MIYLYDSTETDFRYNGKPLPTAYEVDVHNTLNGEYYVMGKYPLDKNKVYKEIVEDRIIKVHTMDGMQPFRIVSVNKQELYVEFEAWPLFYADMRNKLVKPLNLKGVSGQAALNAFKNNLLIDTPFDFYSDITDNHDYHTQDVNERENNPKQLYNALDVFKTIVNRWGGELWIRGYDVRVNKRIGIDTEAMLYEKKNITEFVDATNIEGIVTRLHGKSEWQDEPQEGEKEGQKHLIETTVDSPLINNYSGVVFEKQYTNNNVRTEQELKNWLNLKFTTENIDKPQRTIEVGVNVIDETKIGFADTLILKYIKHDTDVRIKVVGYEYDGFANKLKHVVLGQSKNTSSITIGNTITDLVNNVVRPVERKALEARASANGKNTNFYGKEEPTGTGIQIGDLWYKPVGDGERELYRFTGTVWDLEKVSAGLLGGTLDAENGDVDLINVNVASIVGETSSFVQSWWNGISNSVSINSSGISFARTDGSRNAFLGVNGYEFWLDGNEHGTMGVGGTLPNHRYYPKKSIRLFARNDAFISLSYEGDASGPIGGYGALLVNGETGLVSIHRNLDMSGNQIFDAISVKTRSDIYESVFRTWSDGESFVGGTNGARLGYHEGTTSNTRFLLPKSGDAQLYAPLSMENWNINNINRLYTGSANVANNLYIGTEGLLFQSTSNDPHTGHKPLIISANGTLGLRVNGYLSFRTFRYASGSSGTHFFTDIDMRGYTISNQSDVRLKTNIKKANVDALREIERLEFIDYEWDREKNPEYPEGVQFGIKAQYSPFLQRKNAGEDSYLSIDMNKQINLNSKAIQELLRRVELLEGGNSDD